MTENNHKTKDIWNFIYITDMQPCSPRSYRFNPSWKENWQTAKSQIMKFQPVPEFILIGGDITRDGSIHFWELEEMKKDLDNTGIPYFVVPGNMDTGNKHARKQGPFSDRDDISLNITSEHILNWKKVFGDWKWSFIFKNVRITGICDIVINSGLPEEKDLWDWLKKIKKQPEIDHHIFIMHYTLFIEHPDEPNWEITDPEQYFKWYFSIDLPGRKKLMEFFKENGVNRVITGHVHCHHESSFNSIKFDYAAETSFTQFTDIWPEGKNKLGFYNYKVCGTCIEKNFVMLEKISNRKDGYGPSGHPKPEARDYSKAWEK